MQDLKNRIFNEKAKQDSLKIYEFYESVIVLSRKMNDFYELKHLICDPQLKKPNFFKVEKDKNIEIELYVNSLNLVLKN